MGRPLLLVRCSAAASNHTALHSQSADFSVPGALSTGARVELEMKTVSLWRPLPARRRLRRSRSAMRSRSLPGLRVGSSIGAPDEVVMG